MKIVRTMVLQQACAVLRNFLLLPLVAVSLALEALLILALLSVDIGLPAIVLTGPGWLAVHLAASVIAAAGISWIANRPAAASKRGPFLAFFVWCLVLSLALPLFGALGVALALWYGLKHSDRQHSTVTYWQVTRNPDLPFTTPIGRKQSAYDSRGFTEQLTFGDDADDLYRKVLAAANIRSALSVDALKTAVQNADERVRLTAYQSLDRKITRLNLEIQKLERSTDELEGDEKSNTWLHIASNYWELLTLEKDEPIARRQLLDKASSAAFKATEIDAENRNAFYTLGRVSLLQGNSALAIRALERALELGMPRETVVPYLAECAFDQRDFSEVRQLLDSVDSAFKQYPPLRQLAEYWA